MSRPDDLPHERPIRVRVTPHSLRIDFFSGKDPGRHYTAIIPHAQMADLLEHSQAAYEGRGPREFLLGFDEASLAFHQLAAVEMAPECAR